MTPSQEGRDDPDERPATRSDGNGASGPGEPTENAGRTFAFRGDEILVRAGSAGLALPPPSSLRRAGLPVRAEYRVRSSGGVRDLALDLEPASEPPEGMAFHDLRRLLGGLSDALFFRAGAAYRTLYWHRRRRHCGRCGARTTREGCPAGERRCTACGQPEFLNPTPAVIVLVHREDELLLARSAAFPEGLFSTLAGFVDPGEPLEEAVRREVREEVGVELEDPVYFGSQPWPFPNSLMVGFTARWRSGEIRVDGEEIAEAGWFSLDRIPMVPPPASIARWMIDRFVESHGGDPTGLRSWRR